jgi:hypothetical protein
MNINEENYKIFLSQLPVHREFSAMRKNHLTFYKHPITSDKLQTPFNFIIFQEQILSLEFISPRLRISPNMCASALLTL